MCSFKYVKQWPRIRLHHSWKGILLHAKAWQTIGSFRISLYLELMIMMFLLIKKKKNWCLVMFSHPCAFNSTAFNDISIWLFPESRFHLYFIRIWVLIPSFFIRSGLFFLDIIVDLLMQNISPYIGRRLSGKVLATFVRGNLVFSEGSHAPAACGSPILAK